MNLRNAVASAAAALLCAASPNAQAADLPYRQASPFFVAPATFTWTGAYVGAFLGGGSGQADFRDPRAASIYGGKVDTPMVEGGGQIGYNFQLPASRWVIGVEADGGALGLNGSNTCFAFSGNVVPYNCRVDGKAMATGTGRLGYAFGADGRTLAYVKGGVAALFEERDLSTNNSGFLIGGVPFGASGVFEQSPRVGFTVGAGIEQALSNAWSLKIEYDYADFGTSSIAAPLTVQHVASVPGYAAFANPPSNLQQSAHTLKVGLNYHLGAAPDASLFSSDLLATALSPVHAVSAPAYAFSQGYTVEMGGRYWYSFGSFQRDLGAHGQPNNSLLSRLTYESQSSSGEFFGRIDTPSRIFVKGFVGAGGDTGGHENDEDFLYTHNRGMTNQYVVAYQNTLSGVKGDLSYATADIGYSVLKSAHANIGGFVGYNYYRSDETNVGCTQIANFQGGGCLVPNNTTTGLVQNEHFNSVRVGINGDMWFDRVRLQADAAYLPYVGFSGIDDHLLRTDVTNQLSPEYGRGQGVQLELIASYYFTPNFSVGIGGRYWGMWLPNATVANFSASLNPDPVHVERYGVTAQAGYRFSSFTPEPIVARY